MSLIRCSLDLPHRAWVHGQGSCSYDVYHLKLARQHELFQFLGQTGAMYKMEAKDVLLRSAA
jgi:hypothetical protein